MTELALYSLIVNFSGNPVLRVPFTPGLATIPFSMTTTSKIIVTGVLLLCLIGLGTADYFFATDILSPDLVVVQEQATSSSTQTVTSPTGGVAKHQAADVPETLQTLGFTTTASSDRSMLEQVVGTDLPLRSFTILKNGDRIGAVIWIESPEAKEYFFSLKEALLAAFSPQVRELEDVTNVDPGMPVRNILTFIDPTLSEERLTFVRSGERLLEFHTVLGKENDMKVALDGLSTR